jgi:thiol-disulfide isomerase/thioredoxin
MYKILLILLLLLHAQTQALGQGISGVDLQTLEGKKYTFNHFEELSVIVFLSPSCPLSQKYTLTLNNLAKELQDKATLYGVFAETEPAWDDYKKFNKKYKIQFKLLVDDKKLLVRALAASVTPEAFVFNNGKMVYHGAIDDWVIDLGKTKKGATNNFIRNAVQCAISNTTPVPDYRKPIGCFID